MIMSARVLALAVMTSGHIASSEGGSKKITCAKP